MTKEFDINKPFVTTCGKQAELICKRGHGRYPYLVVVKDEDSESDEYSRYFSELGLSADNDYELKNIPEAAKKIEKMCGLALGVHDQIRAITDIRNKLNELIETVNQLIEENK